MLFLALALLVSSCSDLQLSAEGGSESLVEQQERQIRNAVLLTLIPVLVAFSFFIFIVYRSRREAFFKQQETEFRLQLSELEMKALRAQINPHFIFNCLNSIRHYMMRNDGKQASDYLIKFSQLTRYVLESSSFKMIPLSEDLEALAFYMELEQLRMNRAFDFQINNSVDKPGQVFVPPMMIQPFVENSIWHGLSNRSSEGKIVVKVESDENSLKVTIEDNGRKRIGSPEHALPGGVRKTSMGMSLINERLAVLNRLYKTKAAFSIDDRAMDATPSDGMRVLLTLPIENE